MPLVSLDQWKQESEPMPVVPATPVKSPTSSGGIPSFGEWSGISSTAEPTPTMPAVKSIGTKIFDFFTHSTQELGKDIGGLLTVNNSIKSFDDALKSYTDSTNTLIQQLKDKKSRDEDTAALEKALKLAAESAPKIEDFTPDVLEKTNKQVLGDVAGFGLELLSGGGLEAAKKVILGKSLSVAQKFIHAGRTGAAYGSVAGLVGGLQADEDVFGITKSVLKGTAIGTLLGFGAGALGEGAARAFSKKAVAPLEKKIPVKSTTGETKIPVSTPGTRHAEYAKRQGYEPYKTATDEIQMGAKPKGELPSVQLGEEIKTKIPKGDITYESLTAAEKVAQSKARVLAPVKSEAQIRVEQTRSKFAPVTEKPVIKPPAFTKVESKPGISKVATSIEQDAIESGITKGFKDLAEYDPITIKDQATRTTDLITNDIEKAKRVALGEEAVPEGMKPEALVVAMKEWLKIHPDGEFAAKFAKSPLLSETSVHAQALRILREQDPDSAITKIREVIEVREGKALKRTGTKSVKVAKNKIVNDIKKQIKKTQPTKQNWEEFIKSIEC